MSMLLNDAAVLVKDALTDDLLMPGKGGHCYVASEALYHLMGGKSAGLKPMNVRHEGTSHWFLLSGEDVVDLTADQFQTSPPYRLARGRGFLTKKPSRRAEEVIQRVLDQWTEETGGFCADCDGECLGHQ